MNTIYEMLTEVNSGWWNHANLVFFFPKKFSKIF